MKYIWRLVFIAALAFLYVGYAHPDWIVDPPFPKASALTSDKCYTNCTDPNRPSFDEWGNEFDYQGNLLKVGSCDADLISGQPNPHCPEAISQTPVSDTSNQPTTYADIFKGK